MNSIPYIYLKVNNFYKIIHNFFEIYVKYLQYFTGLSVLFSYPYYILYISNFFTTYFVKNIIGFY